MNAAESSVFVGWIRSVLAGVAGRVAWAHDRQAPRMQRPCVVLELMESSQPVAVPTRYRDEATSAEYVSTHHRHLVRIACIASMDRRDPTWGGSARAMADALETARKQVHGRDGLRARGIGVVAVEPARDTSTILEGGERESSVSTTWTLTTSRVATADTPTVLGTEIELDVGGVESTLIVGTIPEPEPPPDPDPEEP